MTTEAERNQTKEPVTIRIDGKSRAELQALGSDRNRTVSALILEAVQRFLDTELGRAPTKPRGLIVRFAMLPDTGVMHAFRQLQPDRFQAVVQKASLPPLDFVEKQPEWRSLPTDVFSGESDVIEAVNRLPIYWHFIRGASPPRLDWIRPFLEIFVGHCVFLAEEHLNEVLNPEDKRDYEVFRSSAKSGKDLSLRSLVAWAAQSGEDKSRRAALLEKAWQSALVGCQLGTDFHVAVRRVTPILSGMITRERGVADAAAVREPSPQGIDNLDRGYAEFLRGNLTAFTGSLLQSAELLSKGTSTAYLLAGPADLRVPSLNTLAGRKGMFDANDPLAEVGAGIQMVWAEAVSWFRDEVVAADSLDSLRKFIISNFPTYAAADGAEEEARVTAKLEILQSLMQTWVKWFADADEARAFMGDSHDIGASRTPPSEDLVRHYQELGEWLNPAVQMTAPNPSNPEEASRWKFPSLSDRPASPRLVQAG